MKKIIFILSALFFIGASNAQILIDQEVSGNTTQEVAAPEYIRMMPGFGYKADGENYFRAYIDENASTILPVTYQEYIDPETRELDFNLPVGATEGMASVSLTGAATYTIPIFCPPGTAGMQPSLSLVYSSQSGNGIAGYGWNISGLSAITRVGHTIYHDGAAEGIDFIGDKFALDGQRLICKSNNYGEDNSEYYTEIFNGSKIIAHGQEFGDPVWFEILIKDGSIMRYGYSSDSRFTSQKGNPHSWYLDRITDSNGNYIDYLYNTSNVEKNIKEIHYTGNLTLNQEPYNTIKFWYKDRTDKTDFIIAGTHVMQNLLLDHIDVMDEGQIIKTYRLKHYVNTVSKLNEVEEFGSDNTKYNSIVFGYNDVDKENIVYDTQIEPGDCNILYGDFNGDGKPDIFRAILSGNQKWEVYLNDGGSFNHLVPDWQDDLLPRRVFHFTVADINGDGFSDIIYTEEYHEIFVGDWLYVKSLLGGQQGMTKRTLYEKTQVGTEVDVIPYAIDIQGDGKNEFILHYDDENNSYENLTINNVILTNNPESITSEILFSYCNIEVSKVISEMDLTGDGASELMIVCNEDDAIIYTYSFDGSVYTERQIYRSGYPTKWHNIYVADFNGDGISDLLTNVEKDGNIQNWTLAYWMGNGLKPFLFLI